MKKLAFTFLMAAAFMSCSKSPESAGNEVCDCYKTLGDNKLNEVASETKKCLDLTKKYRTEFEGDDLKAFNKATINCVTNGVFE